MRTAALVEVSRLGPTTSLGSPSTSLKGKRIVMNEPTKVFALLTTQGRSLRHSEDIKNTTGED